MYVIIFFLLLHFMFPRKFLSDTTYQHLRVWWYLLHVAMEDPSLAEAGIVIVTNDRSINLSTFSTKLTRGALQSEKLIPIRWCMIHSCHLGANVYSRFASALRVLMSPFQQETHSLHCGTDDEVVEELSSKYSFNRECIPEGLGE